MSNIRTVLQLAFNDLYNNDDISDLNKQDINEVDENININNIDNINNKDNKDKDNKDTLDTNVDNKLIDKSETISTNQPKKYESLDKIESINKILTTSINESNELANYLTKQYNNSIENDTNINLNLLQSTGLLSSIDIPSSKIDSKNIMNYQNILTLDKTLPKDSNSYLKMKTTHVRNRSSQSTTNILPSTANDSRVNTSNIRGSTSDLNSTADLNRTYSKPRLQLTTARLQEMNTADLDPEQIKKARESKLRLRQQQMKMSGEKLAQNKEILTRMKRRLEFLKNPRYTDSSTLLSRALPVNIPESGNFFRMEPEVVQFTDYEIGHIYQIPLNVTNVSSLGRRLRVLPSPSPFFSVNDIVFPTESGLLAPGASVQIFVRFCPESLGDFKSQLTIMTESGQFYVPVCGRRPPPVLSIPKTMDCGCCFVDELIQVSFSCLNSGGPTKFQIIPCDHPRVADLIQSMDFEGEESYLINNFWFLPEDVRRNDEFTKSMLRMGPFQLSRSQFSLERDQEIELQVTFHPNEIKQFTNDFYFMCDNTLVYKYSISGQGWQMAISVLSVDDVLLTNRPLLPGSLLPASPSKGLLRTSAAPINHDNVSIDEMNETQLNSINSSLMYSDPSTAPRANIILEPNPRLFEFNETFVSNQFTRSSSSKKVTLCNASPVPVSFHWAIEQSDVFIVEPKEGVMSGLSTIEFNFVFCSDNIDNYNSNCQFIAESIPSDLLSLQCNIFEPRPLIDLPILDFNLLASTKPVVLTLEPNLIDLSKVPIVLNENYRSSFIIFNPTSSFSTFELEHTNSDQINLIIEPANGQLSPYSSLIVSLIASPLNLGLLDCRISCKSDSLSFIDLKILCTGLTFQIHTSLIDFGLLNFGIPGVSSSQTFNITNTSSVSANYVLYQSDHPTPSFSDSLYASHQDSVLFFDPPLGLLEPNTTKLIKVTYKPKLCERMRLKIACAVQHGETYIVNARGEVQAPNISLSSNSFDLGTCYINVPKNLSLTMHNTSNLPALFSWTNVENAKYKVNFSPSLGQIVGKSEKIINIEYVALIKNPSSRILFGCTIEGCVNPVVLSVNSVVKDLIVTAHISKKTDFEVKFGEFNKSEDSSQFDYMQERIKDMGAPTDLIKKIAALDAFYPSNQSIPIVDFGRDCPINSQNSFNLVFRNHTAISTYIDLAAENLGTDNADSLHALLIGDMAALASQTEMDTPNDNESERNEKIQLKKSMLASSRVSSRVSSRSTSKTSRSSGGVHGGGPHLSNPKLRALNAKWQTALGALGQRPLLTESHETLLRFQSRKGQDFIFNNLKQDKIREILRMGQGVCFAFYPDTAALGPWEIVEIQVHVFTGMCGKFNDNLYCHVSGIPKPIALKASVNVIGSPLELSKDTVGLVIPKDSFTMPSLIFNRDAYPVNSGSFEKQIKICNTGPFDLKLIWRIYSEEDDANCNVVAFSFDMITEDGVNCEINLKETDNNFYFTLPHSELIVKARSSTHLPVVFNAPSHVSHFKAFMKSDIYIHNQDKLKLQKDNDQEVQTVTNRANIDNDWVIAPSELANSPLELFLDATTCSPKLTLDFEHAREEVLKFVVKANKHVRQDEFIEVMPLINKSGALLDFTISVTPAEYFSLAAFDSTALASKPLMPNAANLLSTYTSFPNVINSNNNARVGTSQSIKSTTSNLTSITNATASLTTARSVASLQSVKSNVTNSNAISKPQTLNYHLSSTAKAIAPETTPLFSLPNSRQFYLSVKFNAPSTKSSQWPISPFYSLPHYINGIVQINHANGDTQSFPLLAELHRPKLLVEPSLTQFDVTYCTHRSTLFLQLYNSSIVSAHWSLVHVASAVFSSESAMHPITLLNLSNAEFDPNRDYVDDPTVFSFSDLNGVAPASTLPPSGLPAIGFQTNKVDNREYSAWDKGREPIELTVYFTPKKEANYRSKFRVLVECGESFDIEIYGTGSSNEKYIKR